MAGEGAYDIDRIVDDAGAGIDDHSVSVIVATLVAVWDGLQLLNQQRGHGLEARLPAWGQGSGAIVLLAQTGGQIAWAVVVADKVVLVLISEVALVLIFVVAATVTIAFVALVPISIAMSVAFALMFVLPIAVSVFATVSLCACVISRGEDEANG